ncbi:abl interactor 2-like isoform X9 [Physella acuta]|uniref:abl interactor 2-like isoform X9 n=1 Tax=Physella acuta TaxID=109671 RepID=UPI0027DDB3BE|nr:abl interactor 2-like isoform X9 [Physella acuta]
MAAGEELLSLIDREIPDGRKSLQESYMNLENVAKYCEDNYLKALKTNPNATAQALQDTKNYTTHSLASVAYQINNLATNFLKLLDLQQSQLTDMESSVNHLNQIVMIHKEKVARREIGVLTAGRNVPRPIGMKNGIIYPEQTERPIKYTRKSIDYTILDDVGHGVRQQANTPRTARSPSVSSTHSNSSASNNNQAPTTKPPTPPVYRAGTIGRAAGAQQTRPVAPPMAPPQPIPSQATYARSNSNRGQSWIDTSTTSLPPPPPDDDFPEPFMGFEAQSPLPAPPSNEHFDYPAPPPQDFSDVREGPPSSRPGRLIGSEPEDTYAATQAMDDPYAATGPQLLSQQSWIPKHYLEKVVAIYDYSATKSDELSFAENAVIYVIHKNDDGWWEGVMDGQTGLFPYNYVEPCM